MCKIAFDHDNRVEISGIRDLAKLVGGGSHLVIPNEETSWTPDIVEMFREGPEDNCLCPVDLGWTLLRAGFVVWIDAEWGEVNFRRQPNTTRTT